MKAIGVLALNEFMDGLRNRWVAAAITLLGTTALVLLLVGSAPTVRFVPAHWMSVSSVSPV